MRKQMNKRGKISLFLCMLLLALGISGCAGSGGGDGRSQEASVQTQTSVTSEESMDVTSKEASLEELTEEASEESFEESNEVSSEELSKESIEESLEEPSEESSEETSKSSTEDAQLDDSVVYGEAYNSKDEVALYIHLYQELPPNYITKKEAQKLGWSSGSLEKYAPGKSIGGDKFGNYEGNLPDKKGRKYTECDIDTKGASKRGAKRIVFSNDGLIYYTEDHYETFELLYGEE